MELLLIWTILSIAGLICTIWYIVIIYTNKWIALFTIGFLITIGTLLLRSIYNV